VRDKPKFQETR